MSVVSIDSKMPLKFRGPRAYKRAPEGMKFIAGAVLVHWGPALMYCSVIGDALPFYLMACNHALGVALGILRYARQPGERLSCVPLDLIPNAPESPQSYEVKKAA